MNTALLIGSNGQLGTEIARLWHADSARRGNDLVGLTHADIDITERDEIASVFARLRPRIVINTAAFLRVDECESAPEKAMLVNGLAVKYLADACLATGAFLVHFSTDYVFNGDKGKPYSEQDTPSPLNAYGLSKLMGEAFLRYRLPDRHLIIRTSGLYGPAGSTNKGGNFVETMLRLAGDGKDIRVVDDQVFSPTYALDLAKAVLRLIELEEYGTFHVTNTGSTSWYSFAKLIFEKSKLRPNLQAITSAEFAAPARRPAYSVLDNERAAALGIEPLPRWEQSLSDYLAARGS